MAAIDVLEKQIKCSKRLPPPLCFKRKQIKSQPSDTSSSVSFITAWLKSCQEMCQCANAYYSCWSDLENWQSQSLEWCVFPWKQKKVWLCLEGAFQMTKNQEIKETIFFFKEAYPNLNLFTCLEATSSKRNLKPDHSASVTGFRFCGFMMSVFKTLSVDSFRFLEGQQPCYKSLVRGRPVLSFSTYFISWKRGSNFWETRKPLFWFYIVEQPRRSSNLPKIKWQGGKCSTVQHKQYAMA